MLRLRSGILTPLLASSATLPVSPLLRLLSAAAAAAAPTASPSPPFAVEQYLVATCGLTPAQALKASTKLTHLKSPSRPDAVLAFLAGIGLSSAEVAALVAKDPQFLCAGVEKILTPNVVGLTGLGLSHGEIARLVSLAPVSFRGRSTLSTLPCCLSLFGSYEVVLRIIKRSLNLLSYDFEGVMKPNLTFLRECGLGACDITKLFIAQPRLITSNLERVQATVGCAQSLGVPRGSPILRHALHAVAFLSEEKVAARVEYMKSMFRWSDAEVCIALSKAPTVLTRSKESLQRISEFLISEVGLEPAYIARRPVMINYSLDGRLRPRNYVFKFLKESGLLDHYYRNYYAAVTPADNVFLAKYIHPYKETAPHLAEDYADACRGQVPTRFRFA